MKYISQCVIHGEVERTLTRILWGPQRQMFIRVRNFMADLTPLLRVELNLPDAITIVTEPRERTIQPSYSIRVCFT